MKRSGILILSLLLVTLLQAQTIRDRIIQRRTQKPASTEKPAPGKAPIYSELYYWAAHPEKRDMSDSIPSFLAGEKIDTLADVFFIHPTTYTKDMRNALSNASLDDSELNRETDSKTILYQASIFNNCARIFAPRYRQAHLKNFFSTGSETAKAAFDQAYEDIRSAFEYYLKNYNHGRPIIIAGHSQGAMHAIRLVKEFFDGKPLQKQLVCAYIVGYHIKTDDIKIIPVGERPDQTGCYVGWRTFKKGETGMGVRNETGGSVCVNPISWTTSIDETKREDHKGALAKDMEKPLRKLITASIDPEHKVLWVDLPDKVEEKMGDRLKNYHIADFNLFWLDVRENARLRVESYLKKQVR
jgi:hypothetical protein